MIVSREETPIGRDQQTVDGMWAQQTPLKRTGPQDDLAAPERTLGLRKGGGNQTADGVRLKPILERTTANIGGCPTTFYAEASYWVRKTQRSMPRHRQDPYSPLGARNT
jgi:hypothetical protein